ncbi:MAG TPA: TlpA disulfide reductase family protein [Pyrinomonadaceae bacterium]|nr:TlpA family protein disulfide reductase [Chloracidobacterium sp.]MBP9935851.1 TlpA family protein disulfide reductase [Pyrinomonadaceae bacterium]HRA41715.1 TlpA disulfide reductase family protein [Pyrinomonadaceae bacterium]
MKSALLITLVLIPLMFVGCRPAAAPVAVSNRPVSVNDVPQPGVPMPPSKPLTEMEWTTTDGFVHKLGSYQGKAVILDFWATYCGPCREEIPHLNALLEKYGPDKLVVIGLNVGGQEDIDKVPEFTKLTKINYPIAVPEDALNRFIFAETSSIPQTAIFDRSGKLVQKFVGYGAGVKIDLEKAVETAVNSN